MIVIIYSHQDHLELAEALANALKYQPKIKQVEVTNVLNINKYDQLHIFVDLHHFANLKQEQLPPNYIMYNYQQLPFGRKHKFTMINDKAKNALAIWDYSELNQRLIKQDFGLDSILVPFGYSDTFEPPVQTIFQQIYDIVFIGELSPRRKKLLNYLANDLNLKVIAPPRIDGIAKMELIRQGKILLNMHKRDEDGILESARISFYLSNGAFVISERSSDHRLMQDFDKKIVFGDLEQFPQLIKYYLEHPDERSDIAQRAYQWITTEYQYYQLLPDIRQYITSFKK